jgi:hypothetical protein
MPPKKYPGDSPRFLDAAQRAAEQRRDLELMLARGRAQRELKAEARQKELDAINRPPPNPSRLPDVFDIAKQNYYARAEFEAQVMKQLEFEELMIHREARLRREHRQTMERARKALGDERFNAAMREARRRRGKK